MQLTEKRQAVKNICSPKSAAGIMEKDVAVSKIYVFGAKKRIFKNAMTAAKTAPAKTGAVVKTVRQTAKNQSAKNG